MQTTANPQRFATPTIDRHLDAEDYVGSLEDVLDHAAIICSGETNTANAIEALSDAVRGVEEPTNRDDLAFLAFTTDGRRAVEEALTRAYYRLRLFLLENPYMRSARGGEREQLEKALSAFGLRFEIDRQGELASSVFERGSVGGSNG